MKIELRNQCKATILLTLLPMIISDVTCFCLDWFLRFAIPARGDYNLVEETGSTTQLIIVEASTSVFIPMLLFLLLATSIMACFTYTKYYQYNVSKACNRNIKFVMIFKLVLIAIVFYYGLYFYVKPMFSTDPGMVSNAFDLLINVCTPILMVISYIAIVLIAIFVKEKE